MAQPFGVNRGAPPSEVGGFAGWILAKQAEFYRMLSGLIRAAKADGSAAYTLLGISFLYGVFHAAGPGHGKAVISSYLVANNETWRRGIVLSFASAILQALTAIAIVGVAAGAPWRHGEGDGQYRARDRDRQLCAHFVDRSASPVGERQGLLASAGSRGTGRMPMITRMSMLTAIITTIIMIMTTTMMHQPGVTGTHRSRANSPAVHWLRRGLTAIVAVGLRPCSGAIIVLVFALAQGLFWIGVASTFVMGLGTAITVAAIATLAVGARGARRQACESKAGGRADSPARSGNRGGAGDCVFRCGLAHRLFVSERLMGV